MKTYKKPFLLSLAMLPIALIGGIFVALYQFDMYPPEVLEIALEQMGSMEVLVVVAALQTMMYALVCTFFGCIMAEKIGLWKPIHLEKDKFIRVLGISVIFGIVFSLDYWTFGNVIDGIQEAAVVGITFNGILSAVLYGGIIEEILLRLFFMTLIAFLIQKIFYRKIEKDNLPNTIFVWANIIAALVFAAGHLPATITTFGGLTPLLVFRCFLLNGVFGLVFGRFYRKYGIVYAMLSHMTLHIVSKVIWILFI